MSNVWHPNDNALSSSYVVAASQTDAPVTKPFTITAPGAKHLIVCLTASAVTGTVDVKLQTSVGDTSWVDSKATTIAAAGRCYIKLAIEIAADQTYLPLLSRGRVVVTTGVGEDITISNVYVIQQQ
jgi:hypothetical protein